MAVCSANPPTGIEIRADVWHGVLQCLLDDPKAILSLTQTCTALRELADHENVWQSVATACWRNLATVGRAGYSSYKCLVLDDNRSNAAMALAVSSAACTYRFQRSIRFYECRLVQLQWWRTANSLRLYFDARGEGDLRLPMSSSIAVVKLPSQSEPPCGSSSSRLSPTGAPAAAAAAAPGAPPAGTTFDLDALGTRLLVHAPDACHTFIQKPGHYKGVLIWHAAKTSELLKTLLLQQPADDEGPPLQQHSPVQAGRRSEAWEEWADTQLLQQDDSDDSQAAPSSSSSSSGHNNIGAAAGPACGLLRGCLRHWCSAGPTSSHSSSASATGDAVEPSSAFATAHTAPAGAGPCPRPPAVRHALVFCYANDLKWYHTMHTPDYSITPLAVASPQPISSDAATTSGVPVRLCPSPQGRPYKQRGQVSKHLQRRNNDVQQLCKREEGQLAAAWKRMTGAMMQQPGALDQQLQAESVTQEKLRWSSLPAAVKARGEHWWV